MSRGNHLGPKKRSLYTLCLGGLVYYWSVVVSLAFLYNFWVSYILSFGQNFDVYVADMACDVSRGRVYGC